MTTQFKLVLNKLINYQDMSSRVILILLMYFFAIHSIADDKSALKNKKANLQQSKRVEGYVSSADGERLIGVNVIEVGTMNGTITDFHGFYTLEVKGEKPSLSFTYVGFEPQSVIIGDRKMINIILKEETSSLDEIVVVGYGKPVE